MLNDFAGADKVYSACGYTDLRKGIDGLASLVQQQFQFDPFTNTLFLFCGRRRDRMKGLYWEKDGFILLYKRLEQGAYQWPRSENEVRTLTSQQFDWLMEQMRLAKKKVFGASSEKSHEEPTGQMNFLFDEAELHLEIERKEEASAAGYTRKKRSGGGGGAPPARSASWMARKYPSQRPTEFRL